MSKRAIILGIVFCLGFSIAVASCMGEDPKGMELHDYLREGRRSLEAGDAGEAYVNFAKAREIEPFHRQALWGTVLANNQLIWKNLTGIIDLLSGVYVKEFSRDDCEFACKKLDRCDLFDEVNTTKEDCVGACPWKLQPFMFEEVMAAPTCHDLRYGAIEWIVRTTPANCRRLCESLERCDVVNPPTTYDVEDCTTYCPLMWVERHSQCYLNAYEFECHRFDRTCFEHTVLGLQIIIDKLGKVRVPQTIDFSEILLDRPDDYQYFVKTYDWELREPELTIPLPGRWSRNELYLSQFMNYLWEAFVNFVLAQNLDINTVTFDQFTYRGSTCEVMLRDFLTSIKNTVYDPIFPNAFTLIEPYDKSVEQMRLTAVSLGNMFGAIANMAGEMLADSDNQDGRANGYRDLNRNFRFDRDEYWTFSDTGFGFTFDGMVALQKLGYAMEENLKGGDPVETALFLPVIENVIQNGDERLIPEEAGPIIETLVPLLLKRKYVDFSYPFYNATPDGFRPAVLQLIGFLEDLKANAANLPESWECNDLDPFS